MAIAAAAMIALLGGCAAAPAVPAAPTARLAAFLKGVHIAELPREADDAQLRVDPVFVEEWDLHRGLYLSANARHPGDAWSHALWRLAPERDGRVRVETWRWRETPEPESGIAAAPELVEAGGRGAFRHERSCDLLLEYQANGSFQGEHAEPAPCASAREGVARERHRMIVTPNQLLWSVQGFDAGGERVWTPGGSGGYRFERVER